MTFLKNIRMLLVLGFFFAFFTLGSVRAECAVTITGSGFADVDGLYTELAGYPVASGVLYGYKVLTEVPDILLMVYGYNSSLGRWEFQQSDNFGNFYPDTLVFTNPAPNSGIPLDGWLTFPSGTPATGLTVCIGTCEVETPGTVSMASIPAGLQQPVGSSLVVTANPAGNTGGVEYQFELDSGSGPVVVVPWSASNAFNWDTLGLAAGSYTVSVSARTLIGQVAFAAPAALTFSLFKPATLGVSIVANKMSPQLRGSLVTFTYKAVGGTNPSKEFEASLRMPNGTWTSVQGYATTSTWSWNTTGLAAGTYYLKVKAREAGYTLSSQGEKTIPFALK